MMILDINENTVITTDMIRKYFNALVNCFFKILPMKEDSEPSLITYIDSLKSEMMGCKSLVKAIDNDSMYLSLLSILQYQVEHPECSVNKTRREVFKAISICNKLKHLYSEVV